MLSGSIKNKIYALTSIFILIFLIASFALAVNFLVKINGLVFGVDEGLIEEKTTVLNIDGYNKIKNKVENDRNAEDENISGD